MSLTTQDYSDIQMLYARYSHAADSLDAPPYLVLNHIIAL